MRRFVLILLLPILFVIAAQAQDIPDRSPATDDFGWVTAVINDVQTLNPPEGGKTVVMEGDAFLLGAVHQTGASSKLRLLIEDDSILTLGENTQVHLTESRYDRKTGVRRLSGDLASGILRVMSGPVFSVEGSQFEIRTPTASATTKQGGAYFIVWTTACGGAPATGVLSLDGEVTARAKGAASGVLLSSFFYTKIGETCPPPLPLAVSKSVMAEVSDATALIDPVRVTAVAMMVDEQIDPKRERLPVVVRLTPPIAQVPNLTSLGLRVRVVFP